MIPPLLQASDELVDGRLDILRLERLHVVLAAELDGAGARGRAAHLADDLAVVHLRDEDALDLLRERRDGFAPQRSRNADRAAGKELLPPCKALALRRLQKALLLGVFHRAVRFIQRFARRVQLSAAHERDHLDKAIAAFIKVGKKLGVI